MFAAMTLAIVATVITTGLSSPTPTMPSTVSAMMLAAGTDGLESGLYTPTQVLNVTGSDVSMSLSKTMMLAVGGSESTSLYQIDQDIATLKHTIATPGKAIALSGGSTMLAAGSKIYTVVPATGIATEIYSTPGSYSEYTARAWSQPTTMLVASLGNDDKTTITRVAGATLGQVIQELAYTANALALSGDETMLVTAPQGLADDSVFGVTLHVAGPDGAFTPRTAGAVAWAFATGDRVTSGPAVSLDGTTVYVGSDDTSFYAVDTTTGEKRWQSETGGMVASGPVLSPDGETVYVGSDDEEFYAIHTADGTKKWRTTGLGPITTKPALSPDGAIVYFASGPDAIDDHEEIMAVNTTTGSVIWNYQAETGLSGPATAGDTVFTVRRDGNLVGIDALSGVETFNVNLAASNTMPLSPTVSLDGATVFVAVANVVYAVNTTSGQPPRWQFTAAGTVRAGLSTDGATLFIGSESGVYAINASTGSERWHFSGVDVRTSPVLSPDGATVYVGSLEKSLHAIDAATGDQRWSYLTASDILSRPAVSPDGAIVFVGSSDNFLHAVHAAGDSLGVCGTALALAADKTLLAVGYGTDAPRMLLYPEMMVTVRLFGIDTATGRATHLHTIAADYLNLTTLASGPPPAITSLALSDDNTLLAVASLYSVRVFRLGPDGAATLVHTNSAGAQAVALSGDKTTLITSSLAEEAAGQNGGTVSIFSAPSTTSTTTTTPIEVSAGVTLTDTVSVASGPDETVTALSLSKTMMLATATANPTFDAGATKLLQITSATATPRHTIENHVSSVLALSDDGTLLVTANNHITGFEIDPGTGNATEKEGAVNLGDFTSSAMALSQNKTKLVVSAGDTQQAFTSIRGIDDFANDLQSISDYRSTAVALSDDETMLVTAASNGGPVTLHGLDGAGAFVPRSTGTQRWASPIDDDVRSSPAVSPDGQTVYFGSDDTYLYAVDTTTGAQRWKFPTDDKVRSSPAVSPDGAAVFVGSHDYKLYAVNATDGVELWNFNTGNRVFSSPVLSGATVFVGSESNKLYAINVETGTKKWEFSAGGPVYSDPALSPDNATVYVGAWDNKLFAIDAENGQQKWVIYLESMNSDPSPAVSPDGATVYISVYGAFHAIHANGTKSWSITTQTNGCSTPTLSPDGAVVYFGRGAPHSPSAAPGVYARETATGEEVWSFREINRATCTRPLLSRDAGTVYVTSLGSINLYALDAATGALQWTFSAGGDVRSSPALSPDGGTVFFGSTYLHAVAVGGGDPLGSDATALALAADKTLLAVADGDVGLFAIDPATGHADRVHTIPADDGTTTINALALSGDKTVLAVGSDTSTRIFRVNSNGGSTTLMHTINATTAALALSDDKTTLVVGSGPSVSIFGLEWTPAAEPSSAAAAGDNDNDSTTAAAIGLGAGGLLLMGGYGFAALTYGSANPAKWRGGPVAVEDTSAVAEMFGSLL